MYIIVSIICLSFVSNCPKIATCVSNIPKANGPFKRNHPVFGSTLPKDQSWSIREGFIFVGFSIEMLKFTIENWSSIDI